MCLLPEKWVGCSFEDPMINFISAQGKSTLAFSFSGRQPRQEFMQEKSQDDSLDRRLMLGFSRVRRGTAWHEKVIETSECSHQTLLKETGLWRKKKQDAKGAAQLSGHYLHSQLPSVRILSNNGVIQQSNQGEQLLWCFNQHVTLLSDKRSECKEDKTASFFLLKIRRPISRQQTGRVLHCILPECFVLLFRFVSFYNIPARGGIQPV